MAQPSQLQAWLHAARPRTLPLATACIVLGSSVASYHATFSYTIFIFSLLTALLLQILSNLANDLGDFLKGTDNENRVGQKRALQSGLLTVAQMKRGILFTIVGCLLSGLVLLYHAFHGAFTFKLLLFILLGAMALLAALKYTLGKNPFGYTGFGDIVVFIFFGLVGVAGTAMLHGVPFEWSLFLPATASGLLSAGVLNINNMRDHASDLLAGKKTLAVRLGTTRAKSYHYTLLFLAYLLSALYLVHLTIPTLVSLGALLPLACFTIPMMRRVAKAPTGPLMEPLLKQQSLLTLWHAIILALALKLA